MIKGALGSVAIRFSAIPLSFFISVFLARTLDVNDFGKYSYIISCISLFMLPIFTGWTNFVIREIGTKRGADSSPFRNLAVSTIFINVIFASLAAIFIFITTDYSLAVLIVSFCVALFFSLTANFAGVVRSLGYTVLGQIPDSIVKPSVFLALLLCLFVLEIGLDVRTALLYQLFGLFASLLLVTLLLKKLGVFNAVTSLNGEQKITSLVIFALPFLGMSILNSANTNLPMIYLGNFDSDESVGMFRVAQQISSLVNVCLAGVLAWSAPIVASFSTADKVELKKILRKATLLSLLPTVFGACIVILLSDFIIELVFGTNYSNAVFPLQILVLNELLLCTFLIFQQFLVMTGNYKFACYGLVSSIITGFLLCIFLIPIYGADGASIAVLISTSIWMLFTFYSSRRLGVL